MMSPPLVQVTVQVYVYTNGGRDWDGLCAVGEAQSPINIKEMETKVTLPFDQQTKNLTFYYKNLYDTRLVSPAAVQLAV